jgi:hypothetical protein
MTRNEGYHSHRTLSGKRTGKRTGKLLVNIPVS